MNIIILELIIVRDHELELLSSAMFQLKDINEINFISMFCTISPPLPIACRLYFGFNVCTLLSLPLLNVCTLSIMKGNISHISQSIGEARFKFYRSGNEKSGYSG